MTETVVSLLERSANTRVFTIASPISMPAAADPQTLQTDVSSWPVPALAILRGTVLGAADFTFYYPPPKMIRDGKPVSLRTNRVALAADGRPVRCASLSRAAVEYHDGSNVAHAVL